MKKFVSLLLWLCIAAMLGTSALAATEDWQYDADYYFIRGYHGTEEVVLMPSYIDFCPVEVLLDGIFMDNQAIDTVCLSECMLDLRSANFYNNGKLRKVELPQSLIIIGDDNFVLCPMLQELKIPSQVSYIGANCFNACDALKSITFEGVCPVFGPDCMMDVAPELTIYVPDDQLDAYRAALPGKNVQPSGVNAPVHDFTSDENYYIIMDDWIYAYEGYETRVDVPAVIYDVPMTAVGDYAFPESAYISYITLPEGITTIGMEAFSNMEQLFYISLPSTLKEIGSMAFDGFKGYHIDLPEGLTTIGPKAFRGSNLQGELVLPSTVTSVNADFLLDCPYLTKLVVKGNPLCLSDDLLAYCPDLEITVPADATENQKKLLDAYLNGIPALTITTEPIDTFAYYGEEAAVTVEAAGDMQQYAWYVRNANDNDFVLAEGVTDNRYSVIMDQAAQGRQVYCVVTDLYGNTVETGIATFSGGTALAVTAQPAYAVVPYGEWAQTAVEAIGDGLQYAWYVKDPWSEDFQQDMTCTGNTYGLTMTGEWDPMQVYCVVTDQYGNTVTTEMAMLAMQADAEPEPAPMPVPVGTEGEPFLGTWHLLTLDMGGMAFSAADLGMAMDVTFHADGTIDVVDDGTLETGVWTVVGGVANVMDMNVTLLEDGRLCMEQDGAQMFFGREAESGIEMSEEELLMAMLALMAQSEGESESAETVDYWNKKYVAKQFTTSGITLDAAMLGTEYSLCFREDGTCDLSMAGVMLPNLPWIWSDEMHQSLVINYYGVEFAVMLTEKGFDMDYYGSMILHFELAE